MQSKAFPCNMHAHGLCVIFHFVLTMSVLLLCKSTKPHCITDLNYINQTSQKFGEPQLQRTPTTSVGDFRFCSAASLSFSHKSSLMLRIPVPNQIPYDQMALRISRSLPVLGNSLHGILQCTHGQAAKTCQVTGWRSLLRFLVQRTAEQWNLSRGMHNLQQL